MSYSYLWINLLTISLPLIASFHPRLRFDRLWKPFGIGLLVMLTIFIPWDIAFTIHGFWGFNPQYLTGLDILRLPVEEWLFFICIPYACVFTYYCLTLVLPRLTALSIYVLIVTAIIGLFFSLTNLDSWYTLTSFGSVFLTSAALLVTRHYAFLTRFTISFLLLLIPFKIVNGRLTGTGIEDEIVWYNSNEFMGYRWGTIPFEDIAYAWTMLLICVAVFEYWRNKPETTTG